jgi:hypothetical protein
VSIVGECGKLSGRGDMMPGVATSSLLKIIALIIFSKMY